MKFLFAFLLFTTLILIQINRINTNLNESKLFDKAPIDEKLNGEVFYKNNESINISLFQANNKVIHFLLIYLNIYSYYIGM